MIERGAFAAGAETDMEQQDLFEDDARITDYAKESIYALKNRGILLGQGNGFFEPQGCATRAEAAKLVYSIISGGK